MPIQGIEQPEEISLGDGLRLRKYGGVFDFALPWYQDPVVLKMSERRTEPYKLEKLAVMYRYLDSQGELYWIEVQQDGLFVPIGDATFWQEDMPITIGVGEYRGKGIGKKVAAALVERGRQLGYDALYVGEIFDYNIASQQCFRSVGFVPCGETEHGHRYRLDLR